MDWDIMYQQRVPVSDQALQGLGKRPWPELPQVLERSFTWITAHDGERLVGFVNVAWDGDVHYFLLDTIVHPAYRHRAIGSQLVREAIAACRGHGDWLHVDSDQALMRDFYGPCGFEATPAGLVSLREEADEQRLGVWGAMGLKNVWRRGDVIHKKAGPWTATTHAVLRHLEAVGFDGAPRVVGSGFDEEGRETLTYIEGSFMQPGPWTLDGAAAVGRLLRRFHDAMASFKPPAEPTWYPLPLANLGGPRKIVGHRDLGSWNIVARQGMPVAFIDWERAGPVDPLLEVAQACWLNAKLHDDIVAHDEGLPPLQERARQLRAIADGYGLSRKGRAGLVDRIIEVVVAWLAAEADELQAQRHTEGPLWGFAWPARGGAWILRHRAALEAALA